jgi:hypothetical protein
MASCHGHTEIVIMLTVIMLSVIIQSAIILTDITLSFVMLSVTGTFYDDSLPMFD